MSETVTLRPRHLREATRIASKRGPKQRDIAQSTIDSYKGRPGSERHILGAIGEMAVAEWYGIALDNRPERDPGYDFVVDYRGVRETIDVKATTYPDGALRVGTDGVTADYYLLAIVENTESTEIELIGMVTAADLQSAETVEAPHSGDIQYSIPQSGLDNLPSRDEITS